MTYFDVVSFLEKNKDIQIITDVKDDNIDALRYFADHYSQATERIIPQIYTPIEYGPVKRLGYKKIIFTIYAYKRAKDINLLNRYAKSFKFYALTVPKYRCTAEFCSLISQNTRRLYAHTVNSCEELSTLKNRGVTEVYTDYLAPIKGKKAF
ncbi:hypothetical protein JCM16814_35100 [Desulfobaculum senezii]